MIPFFLPFRCRISSATAIFSMFHVKHFSQYLR